MSWRIGYRIDTDAIVIGEVFKKKSGKTPQNVIEICKKRFDRYDEATE